MASMLCLRCSTPDESVEFPSVVDFLAHEKSGHTTRPVKVLPPSPPVTPSATELKAMKEAEQKGTKISVGEVIEYTGSAPPIVIKPLELVYKWVGVHAPCNSEPKTIEIDLNDNQVAVVAFCFNCNEKLLQQEVPKILKTKQEETLIIKKKK